MAFGLSEYDLPKKLMKNTLFRFRGNTEKQKLAVLNAICSIIFDRLMSEFLKFTQRKPQIFTVNNPIDGRQYGTCEQHNGNIK